MVKTSVFYFDPSLSLKKWMIFLEVAWRSGNMWDGEDLPSASFISMLRFLGFRPLQCETSDSKKLIKIHKTKGAQMVFTRDHYMTPRFQTMHY